MVNEVQKMKFNAFCSCNLLTNIYNHVINNTKIYRLLLSVHVKEIKLLNFNIYKSFYNRKILLPLKRMTNYYAFNAYGTFKIYRSHSRQD